MSAPLLPFLALPELNTKAPLTPRRPEFVVLIVIEALDVAVPSPASKDTAQEFNNNDYHLNRIAERGDTRGVCWIVIEEAGAWRCMYEGRYTCVCM